MISFTQPGWILPLFGGRKPFAFAGAYCTIVQCGEPTSSFAPIGEHVERLNAGRGKASAILEFEPLH